MRKTTITKNLIYLCLSTFMLLSCSSDDDISTEPVGPVPTGNNTVYNLSAVAVDNISGTATVIENDDNSITVDLDIANTSSGGIHPAHVHFNTAAESGGIAISLESVDGSTGKSSTTFSAQDDGTPITYEELLDFNGYINVHLSPDDLGTIVAQGDIGQNVLTGETKIYTLESVAVDGIDGTATFSKRKNGQALAALNINNTPAGGEHPAHIHFNTAVEGGGIAFTFTPVNGDTGTSVTNVAVLDDDTPFVYDDVLGYNGYINVHLSAEDLETIVAQGDIGQNELTGETKVYNLESVAVEGIDGTATFEERVNGQALATLNINNTPDGGMHPAHIHFNTAVEGGGIAFTFTPVNGDTGISKTNVAMLDDDTAFGYEDVLGYNGYINVHLSAEDLGTIVAQGDIGQNELTGEAKVYELNSVAVENINGTATFEERVNGQALATLNINNTPDGGMHPAHIHFNTAVEGGGIAFTFTPVNGDTGISKTNVATLDDDTAFGYEDVLDYNGYINVHLSAEDLGTIVAQGDIGQNELTGESKIYDLNTKDVPGISGTANLEERKNGTTLISLNLTGTPPGGMHPAHIHENDIATTGGIIVSLNAVNGTTGMSKTQVSALDDMTAISYTQLLEIDGYINVHLSAEQLGVIVAQGNIGSNEE